MDIKQAKVKFHQFFAKNKRLPSYGEMCDLFDFSSKKACFDWASKLIEKDFLVKDEKGKLIPGANFFSIPLLGSIKAGLPDSAYQDFVESIVLDKYLVKNLDKAYALRVSGDSMINAGIYENDLVIVDKDRIAKDGDIIVAHIDNQFTLKYLRNKKGKVYLKAANSKYGDIYPEAELNVFGVVVSVVRKYF